MAIRAARSVLCYSGDDIEVILLDNSDEPVFVPDDLRMDPRLQSVRSSKTLGMRDNWERGLDVACGHYVTYVADKDVFLPGAINVLLERLRSLETDVVCYRKGWYFEDRKNVMLYRCDGGFASYSTAPLLDTWFDDPRHLHSAPMVFNSAVQRELVNRIRSRTGRFFVGNSPDVCSGMLLSVHLSKYHQLDRMLSVAHGGAWSMGYAARRFGRNHPNTKAFFAEHGSNPLDPLGLPATLCSAVVEIILAIQRDHPSAFGNRTINWIQYLQRAHQEIEDMEVDEATKREEFRLLMTTKCVVPRSEYFRYIIKTYITRTLARIKTSTLSRIRSGLARMRLLSLTKIVTAALASPLRLFASSPKGTGESVVRVKQSWDDRSRILISPASSIEQAVELAKVLNPLA